MWTSVAPSPDRSDDVPHELSPEQLRELAKLENRLDIEDPQLAELMRRANPGKRARRGRSVLLAVACGLVLVTIAHLVSGFVAAVATGIAATLTGYFWVRNRTA
jgi:Flp pilus assembly protein TadB